METKFRCYLISGISGTGKSTIGKLVAEKLGFEFFEFVEGDDYYLKEKPKVALSNGKTVANWDCVEAIDWDRLNNNIKELLKTKSVILVTFLPQLDLFTFPVWRHIRFEFAFSVDSEDIIEWCIEARKKSKKFISEKQEKLDEMMVREVVYPFYQKINYSPNYIVFVYENNKRRTLEDITSQVISIINTNINTPSNNITLKYL